MVLAPKDRANAIFARSTRRKPVAELIITIGPDAKATAMIRGSYPKPNRLPLPLFLRLLELFHDPNHILCELLSRMQQKDLFVLQGDFFYKMR